jgi:hypothetical protein
MLGILLAATVAASPPPSPTVAQRLPCPAVHKLKTAGPGAAGPRKLGDLPDGELYHAIWKEAGGCPIDEVFFKGRWIDRWTGAPSPAPRNAAGDNR